ncbi:MAG: ATP-dependent helicase [Actinomycetota bacterium]|nr:ATP-dependent helicase [Actinomycetota bacterium]
MPSARSALAALDEAQQYAVTTDAAPLCILAGAGAGKTRVLTRRVARRILEGSADADHVLVLTFTRRAAGELRERLFRLGADRARRTSAAGGVTAGTFHSVAYATLRRYWADSGLRPMAVVRSRHGLLLELAQGDHALASAAGTEIAWAKARLVGPSDYASAVATAGRRPGASDAGRIGGMYTRYEAALARRGVLDVDDLLVRCRLVMESEPSVADVERWRFRHFFVDELQDVNPAQMALLRAWLGGRDDLCVVGDPAQAIYAWNGSDPELLARFPQIFPGAEVVRLTRNYRSTHEIVVAASSVLPAAERSSVEAIMSGPLPTVRSFDDENAEAVAIARSVRRARGPGTSWSQIAVLARTHAQLSAVSAELEAAGIPWARTGADGEHEGVVAPGSDQSLPHGGGPDDDDGKVGTGSGGEPRQAVALSTFHAAKGLEWDAVFVAGIEDGLVPHRQAASSSAARAEERRLLYVALSRATRSLHISWARRRNIGGRPVARRPSPWLAAVESALASMGDLMAPISAQEGLQKIEGLRSVLADSRPVGQSRLQK